MEVMDDGRGREEEWRWRGGVMEKTRRKKVVGEMRRKWRGDVAMWRCGVVDLGTSSPQPHVHLGRQNYIS